MAAEIRTAAGRALLNDLRYGRLEYLDDWEGAYERRATKAVLAIEAEAWRQGIEATQNERNADERRRFVEQELAPLLAKALEERLGPEIVWRPLRTGEDPWVYYADRVIHALRSMLETYPDEPYAK